MEIEGLKYIPLAQAAAMFGMRNDRFGKTLKKYLIPNGVRVFNTSRNNKGIKICLADLETIQQTAMQEGISISEIELVETKS